MRKIPKPPPESGWPSPKSTGRNSTGFAEARSINRLRDERGLFNDLWASGIARRAILSAGRRLALQGRPSMTKPWFSRRRFRKWKPCFWAARAQPRTSWIRRASRRLGVVLDQVPLFIGDPPAPSPPLEGFLPTSAKRLPPSVWHLKKSSGRAPERTSPVLKEKP